LGIEKIRYIGIDLAMSNLLRIYSVWPSAEEFARDIGEPGVKVRQWRNRSGSIPPRYWSRIRSAAARRGAEIPLEWFVPTTPNSEGDENADRPARYAEQA
jgi:hypothetical protein